MARLLLLIISVAVHITVTAQGKAAIQRLSGDSIYFEAEVKRARPVAGYHVSANESVRMQVSDIKNSGQTVSASLLFTNISDDTVTLKNVVPFGEDPSFVYITGKGNHGLSRTHLFRPGYMPVNVIVPDNAWDLGFCTFDINAANQVSGLVRRDRSSIQKGTRTRFETILYPGGSVRYLFYASIVKGSWVDGLKYIFKDRMLYDTATFDNSLYERADLQWIRHTYVHHLMMAWDKFFYDGADKKFHLDEFLARGKKLYGGDDVISLWPTWPTLGLDQRNQFDLFRDLPGGTKKLKSIAESLRKQGTKFFVCYNPWDESTRLENHFSGLSDLIAATSADGVILDTRGGSSRELQEAADRVRKGVVMYSEGMAVPKDMTGIVSGRVHNALYYPPMLNLNKLIKPEFAIYRVAELYKEPIRREFATSFFNGYGTEINIMSPGQPGWVEEQYRFLGKTSRILRENTHNFVAGDFTPLKDTRHDSIWVNEWRLEDGKIIYTIYSIRPEGFKGWLFDVLPFDGQFHYVDLWNHRMLDVWMNNHMYHLETEIEGFHKKYLGTNNEGAVSAVARLPILLNTSRTGDKLVIRTKDGGDELRIWAGDPSYEKKPLVLKPGNHEIALHGKFGRYEGKIVIQLMKQGVLMDENIIELPAGESRRISVSKRTTVASAAPRDMVKIPGGDFFFTSTHGDEFIGYPAEDEKKQFELPAFYMDRYPVTNAEFLRFMLASKYKPSDTANFLKHWNNGNIPAGMENFPVVYISYEDAQAYAKWAGKRLPTEIEWQYAAQTADRNEWPWKQERPVTRKLREVNATLTVSEIEGIDSNKCNLGDGKLYRVGKYPAGANPYGLHDLVGCVWQLTNDVYMNGSYRYIMMKGGSYFKPSGSWWYVQGGPRELHYRQYLLRVSQGFERNATVGFRCVKDL